MAQAQEKFFPFDGTDREYKADDFARYYRAFVTSGVFMNVATNLQVMADSGMQIKVKTGAAIINGYRYDNTADLAFTIDAADGLLNRIDRIVVRWDKENREIYTKVLKGTAAETPTAPAITRTSDIIDYALADIAIDAGATEITQADITDKRMDSTVCGEAFPWAELDTSTLAEQYEAWVHEAMESGDAAAQALLEEMRDILDGSAAGHLQNEIDEEKLLRQGYESATTVFNQDGSITTEKEDGSTETTVFNQDGSITTTLKDENNVTIGTTTTVFNADGSITTTASRPTSI